MSRRASVLVLVSSLLLVAPARARAAPLAVVLHQPEGEAQTPPALSVTFNQPMVPVTSLGQLAGAAPIRVEPAVQGTWKWIDTSTLVLTPKQRLPFATRYRVTVPAGTRSASGDALLAAFTWSFSTPRPQLVSSAPAEGSSEQPLDPAIVLVFNEAVRGEVIAPKVALVDPSGAKVPLRVIPRAEHASNKKVASAVSSSNPERVAAFAPTTPLRPNTRYRVELAAGLRGDEGPLVSMSPSSTSFSTYAPFLVEGVRCGSCWGGKVTSVTSCTVGTNLCLAFNHEVASEQVAESVTITPRPDKLHVRREGQGVLLQGRFTAERRYTIEAPADLKDTHGQVLGRAFKASIEIAHLPSEVEPLVEREALLELKGRLELPLRLLNVKAFKVEAYRITDELLREASALLDQGTRDQTVQAAVHRWTTKVLRWEESTSVVPDERKVHMLGLRRLAQQHGPGSYLVLVEGAPRPLLVQLTDLGITARYDSLRMVVLATTISTGAPRRGVTIRVGDREGHVLGTAISGADGTAVITATGRTDDRNVGALLVTASDGQDRSFLHASSYGDDQRSISLNWGREQRPKERRVFLYADRDTYRPGETVYVHGVDRRYVPDRAGTLAPPHAIEQATWTARTSRGRELATGTTQTTAFGTFAFSFRLPDAVPLGAVEVHTEQAHLSVNVQEYRAPPFEVKVALTDRPYLLGDTLKASVQGRYLFGAPMRKASVKWTLYGDPGRFAAEGQNFHFGSAPPRWHHYERWHDRGPSPIVSGTGTLDAAGQLALDIPLAAQLGALDPMALTIEAQVSDVSRQVVAGTATARANPTDRYVGLRTPQGSIEAGHPTPVDLVLVDLAGQRVTGSPIKLSARLEGVDLEREDDVGRAPAPARVEVAPCSVRSSGTVQSCSLTLPRSGTYLLDATSVDSRGRPVKTQLYVHVAGTDTRPRDTRAERIELSLDRKSYAPGQTARVTLRAPFPDGGALLTEERRGLLAHRVVRIVDHRATVQVRVEVGQIPNVEVSVAAIRARGKDRPRAAWAIGTISIPIDRTEKTLKLVVTPARTEARPGELVRVDVLVTDAAGQPVAARVSLIGVDEAVLSLTGFVTPDALPFFHHAREAGATLAELLKLLLPEDAPVEQKEDAKSKKAAERMSAAESAADMSGPAGGAASTATRRRFLTTPLDAVVDTDQSGHARFSMPLPDNLTRFRLMALAVDRGDRFGSGESGIVVRRKLQVRANVPRFLQLGDEVAASLLVDNQTNAAGEVKLALRVEGATLIEPGARTLQVPAGEVREVTFRMRALAPGSALVHAKATLGPESDAVEVRLPVQLPITTEAFATYGATRVTAVEPLAAPKDVTPGVGGLSVSLSSTALMGLSDAARYLLEYPYGCAEQVSSKALPILVLGDLVRAFGLGGPDVIAAQQKHAQVVFDRLVNDQRSDGSWGTWSSSDGRADLSAYILLVLRRAKEAGMPVPDETVTRATSYLRDSIQRQEQVDTKAEPWRRRWADDIAALALYATSEWGQRDEATARRLYARRRGIDVHARAMLAAVFHRLSPQSPERAVLLRDLENQVIQTPSGARFQEQQTEALPLLMHSSSRTDAIVMLTLLEIDPKHVLLPKIARALLDARVRGRWETTQANAYAIWALARYFKVVEAAPTDFKVGVLLDEQQLAEDRFSGRTMDERRHEVPIDTLLAQKPTRLTLRKEGSGLMYYRVGLRYAPRSASVPRLDQGFLVERRYEGVESPGDVSRGRDGRWTIRAGAYVRVRLTVTVQDRRHYVVVDDPLPAGLELVDTAYKTSARNALADGGESDDWGRSSSWRFDHRELRDDRSLHFADELTPGTYQLIALARATNAGKFVVPPTRAEEMYHPEVFGRTATDRVTVR